MEATTEKIVQNEVGKCLHEMGVYPNIIGFTNLINTVISVVDKGFVNGSLCEAYEDAGKKINKSGASVERSIRTLINKCEVTNGLTKLNDYFGHRVYHDYPISSGELVSLFASKIMIDFKN